MMTHYRYELVPADILIKEGDMLDWNKLRFHFIHTPGHSRGAICINLGKMLFTGDTIMPFKPYFNGRDSNEEDWYNSVELLKNTISRQTLIYPGHGNSLDFEKWLDFLYKT